MQNAKLEILLLEDNPAQADLIKELLSADRKQEFSVQHVQYLAEGLGLLRSRNFDCALVDLGLADSQGLESALAVRNQSKLMPIVVLTSLVDEDAALKSIQMDIQDYLVKG
jgi:DNA-binding response OmpR family regulator